MPMLVMQQIETPIMTRASQSQQFARIGISQVRMLLEKIHPALQKATASVGRRETVLMSNHITIQRRVLHGALTC